MVTPRRPCLELLPIRQPDGGSREVHDNFRKVTEWASEKCEELADHEERITALEALVVDLEARIAALEGP